MELDVVVSAVIFIGLPCAINKVGIVDRLLGVDAAFGVRSLIKVVVRRCGAKMQRRPPTRPWRVGWAAPVVSESGEPKLFHELGGVPEEDFFGDLAVSPARERGHCEAEGFAGRWDLCAVWQGHWLCERADGDSGDGGPVAHGYLDRVGFDSGVGHEGHEVLHVECVRVDPCDDAAVWHNDVSIVGVKLTEQAPVVFGVGLEVHLVEAVEELVVMLLSGLVAGQFVSQFGDLAFEGLSCGGHFDSRCAWTAFSARQ